MAKTSLAASGNREFSKLFFKLTSAALAFFISLSTAAPAFAEVPAAPAAASLASANPAPADQPAVTPDPDSAASFRLDPARDPIGQVIDHLTAADTSGQTPAAPGTAIVADTAAGDTSVPPTDIAKGDAASPKGGTLDGGGSPPQQMSLVGGVQSAPYQPEISNKSTTKQPMPQVNDNTGALGYAYPIAVPPGRNGMQPGLAITYSSQSAFEEPNLLGKGWSISIPYVERGNKLGVDQLYSPTSSNWFFSSSLSGELNLTGTSTFGSSTVYTYGARVENGDFTSYTFDPTGNTWTAYDKQGETYKFGYASSSRMDSAVSTSTVFRWMLQEVRDLNDNYVKYEYFKDKNQIYPSRIVYTGSGVTDGPLEVTFNRESATSTATSSKTGFPVYTAYRISDITTSVSGSWVKKYTLGYTANGNGSGTNLASITESGRDESGNVTSTPATTFTYAGQNQSFGGDSSWDSPLIVDEFANTVIGDVNGDSYPDILSGKHIPTATSSYDELAAVVHDGSKTWNGNATYTPPTMFSFYDTNGNVTATKRTRIADINGDQLGDLVGDDISASYGTYPNTGSGWGSGQGLPLRFSYSSGLEARNGQLADMNGDGLPDLVQAYDSGGSISTYVYLNHAGSFLSDSGWSFPVDLRYGTAVVDVNGDGLADIFKSYRYTQDPNTNPVLVDVKGVWLNQGNKTFASSTDYLPPAPISQLDIYDNELDKHFRLVDANGDGLVDMLGDPVAGTSYTNTGKGWVASEDVPPWFFLEYHQLDPEYKSRPADLNADGLPDLLKTYLEWNGVSYSTVTVAYLNGAVKPLLSAVNYPTGGKTTITYKSSAQQKNGSTLLNPRLPIIVDTVSAIGQDDGIGAVSTTTLTYENGSYYFASSTDRKFAGFGKITKADPVGNKTVSYFHQGDTSNTSQGEYQDDYWKTGKPYRVEQQDASGNAYQVTINKWDNVDLGSGRRFVKLAQSLAETFDGGASHKDAATAFTYGTTTGNLLTKVDYGEVSGSTDGTFSDTGTDKFTTAYTYATSSTSTLNLLATETVTDNGGAKVRETRSYYDSLSLNVASKGNQTKQDQWKSSTSYASTTQAYNSYGLPTSSTDARGKTTSYSYDSLNLYVATSTNPFSQKTLYLYDYSLGKAKQVTDPNGAALQTVFDGLDRVTQENQTDPAATSTFQTKTSYSYTYLSPGLKVQRNDYLSSTTVATGYTYSDGLGRPIQTRKQVEVTDRYAAVDTIYNSVGEVWKQSLPYFSVGSGRTSVTVNTYLYTSYTYDPLLRVTASQDSIGTTTKAYDRWKTTVTDPRGNQKSLYADAFGRLKQVDEVNGTSTYTTAYTWDGNGQLTGIADALNNIRSFTYDGLGRRLTAQDLHASGDGTFGSYSYAYDDGGNLTQGVDPKSQTVNYTYDDLSRPLTEDFTGATGTEASYAYDTCTYGKGRLCTATSTGAVETRVYDALGNIATQNRTIGTTTYATAYTYDRQGNVLTLTNPDSSQVKYTYNTVGLMETVQRKESGDAGYTDVVTNFDYSPLGQITIISYANHATTTNTYDANKRYRLKRKLTTVPAQQQMMMRAPGFGPEVSIEPALTITPDQVKLLPSSTPETVSSTLETASSTLPMLFPFVYATTAKSVATTIPEVVDQLPDTATGTATTVSSTPPVELLPTPEASATLPVATTTPEDPAVAPVPAAPIATPEDVSSTPPVEITPAPEATTVPPEATTPQADATATPVSIGSWLGHTVAALYRSVVSSIVRAVHFALDHLGIETAYATGPIELYDTTLYLDTSLVSYWRLEGNSSDAKGSAHGTDHSVTYGTSYGKFNQGAHFTSGAYYNGSIAQPTSGYSISGWFSHASSSIDNNEGIWDSQNPSNFSTGLTFVYNPSMGKFRLYQNNGAWVNSNDVGATFEDGAKHLITVTWTGSTVTFYMDGSAIGSTAYAMSITNWGSYVVGQRTTSNQPYLGDIDDLAVFSHALSADEANNLYTGNFPPPPDPPAPIELYETPLNTDSNKITYLRLEGNSTDTWGNNNGTDNNVTYGTSSGEFNQGVSFPANGGIKLGKTAMPTSSSMSVAGWVKPAGNGTQNGGDTDFDGVLYYGFYPYFRVGIKAGSARTLRFEVKSGTVTPGYGTNDTWYITDADPSLDLNAWSHVAFVHDGATGIDSIYVNGVLKKQTTTFRGGFTTYDDPLYRNGVGARYYNYANPVSNYFNGPTDDVAAFSRALTADEVYKLYSGDWGIIDGTPIQDFNYTYDAAGNVTKIVDASQTNTAKTVDYTYDALNRLLSMSATSTATGSPFSQTYSYDAIGDILTKSDVSGTYSYSGSGYANPHAVTSIGSTTYSYDNNGNVTAISGGLSNTWDYANRLAQTVLAAATTTYAYDQSGQRVKMVTPSKTFVYPTKSYSLEGTTKVKHIFAGSLLLATVRTVGTTTTATYDHADHLSSTGVTTDDAATIAELTDYYPYGQQRFDEQPGGVVEQRKFIGERYDQGTGLSYLNARYYNPTVGRFTGQDPVFVAFGNVRTKRDRERFKELLADPQNLNSYAYSRNNPLLYVDPDGELPNPFNGISAEWFVRVGNAANTYAKYDSSFDYITSHEWVGYVAGGVGVAAGGAAAALAGLGAAGVTTLGSMCLSYCNTASQEAQIITQAPTVRDQLLQSATDPKLRGIIRELYRRTAQFGDGGTADALRYETQSGQLLSKSGHLEKALGRIAELTKYLRQDNLSVQNRNIAQSLLNNLNDAVKAAEEATK